MLDGRCWSLNHNPKQKPGRSAPAPVNHFHFEAIRLQRPLGVAASAIGCRSLMIRQSVGATQYWTSRRCVWVEYAKEVLGT